MIDQWRIIRLQQQKRVATKINSCCKNIGERLVLNRAEPEL